MKPISAHTKSTDLLFRTPKKLFILCHYPLKCEVQSRLVLYITSLLFLCELYNKDVRKHHALPRSMVVCILQETTLVA